MLDRLHALLDQTWTYVIAAVLAVLAGVAVGYWAVATDPVETRFTQLPAVDTPSPSRGTR